MRVYGCLYACLYSCLYVRMSVCRSVLPMHPVAFSAKVEPIGFKPSSITRFDAGPALAVYISRLSVKPVHPLAYPSSCAPAGSPPGKSARAVPHNSTTHPFARPFARPLLSPSVHRPPISQRTLPSVRPPPAFSPARTPARQPVRPLSPPPACLSVRSPVW